MSGRNRRSNHGTDQNRVLCFINQMQDGAYGCGFKSIAERVHAPGKHGVSCAIGWERASDAVDSLVKAGFVTIHAFLGMEEFHVTEKGKAVAVRLKID